MSNIKRNNSPELTLEELVEKIIEYKDNYKNTQKEDPKRNKYKFKYYRYAYELVYKLQTSDLTVLEPYAKKIGISANNLYQIYRNYRTKVLKIAGHTEETNARLAEKNIKKWHSQHQGTTITFTHDKYYEVIAEIIMKFVGKTKNEDEIIKYFIEIAKINNKFLHNMSKKVASYVADVYGKSGLPPQTLIKLEIEINNIIEVYNQYHKKAEQSSYNQYKTVWRKNQKESTLALKTQKQNQAKNIVLSFINSDYRNIDDFCVNNCIEKNDFEIAVILVKKTFPEIYIEYIISLINKSNDEGLNIYDIIEKIISPEKCFSQNKTTSCFDIIDYYLMIRAGIDINTFRNIIEALYSQNRLTPDQYNKLADIISNLSFQEENLEEIEKIKSGQAKTIFLLDEEPYSPNELEINIIIEFLKNNNIPLNEYHYTTAMRKYINRSLMPIGGRYIKRKINI